MHKCLSIPAARDLDIYGKFQRKGHCSGVQPPVTISSHVILYSLSTSLVLLCSLKTQDYALLLSTFITEYDVLLLWLSQSLSVSLSHTPCAHRLNTAHFTDTPTFLLIIYHTLIHVHTQCHISHHLIEKKNVYIFFLEYTHIVR